MTEQWAQKFSYAVNTVILLMVFGLMYFFSIIEVDFLVRFSIPTIAVYIIGYILIWHKKLDFYVWMVYLWITIYMGITTLCLGHDFGFHLYCMSMIPVMFVTEYISYKLNHKSLKAMPVCVGVVVFYLICTSYVSFRGPLYDIDKNAAGIFWMMNSLTVFGFLIFYTNWLIKTIVQSEDKLRQMAHIDKLTGLYNRHYMMELLEQLASNADGSVRDGLSLLDQCLSGGGNSLDRDTVLEYLGTVADDQGLALGVVGIRIPMSAVGAARSFWSCCRDIW